MSFFGFDPTTTRGRGHNAAAPGFGPAPDAFAGLRGRDQDTDQGEILDFDTYDGLGDQLDEGDDEFNDDTFGSGTVGRDFDFSGQTSNAQGTVGGNQQRYAPQEPPRRASPPKPTSRSARTGYEKYKQPDYIPNLEASADIWGTSARRTTPSRPQQHASYASAIMPQQQNLQRQPQQVQHQQQYQSQHAQLTQQPLLQQNSMPSIATVTRTMMSLEEVEAAMRAQSQSRLVNAIPTVPSYAQDPVHEANVQHHQYQQGPQIMQHPQHTQANMPQPQAPHMQELNTQYPQAGAMIMQELNGGQPQHTTQHQGLQTLDLPRVPQVSTLQNREPPYDGPAPPQTLDLPQVPELATMHSRGPSNNGPVVIHPSQIMQLSEQERAAYLSEDAKRAKRNHKIHLLSRDNGLMTPQDKNFITRIQLQQLVTATGGLEDQSPDAALAEDFYYQVFSQIRGGRSNHPSNLFAQTYLNQTGGRGNRRFQRGGDQMRRMEQQVQRAVEAAKLKPKNKQLVIEGSLGKISFSNAKTPKPLLNLKRQDSSDSRSRLAGKTGSEDPVAIRKSILKDIENLYSTLLLMEDHERKMPPPTTEESSADDIQAQMDWRQQIQELNARLWRELKVLEPIDPASPIPHPFIAILSHPKGKKLIPRVFRQIEEQQRLTILTMIVVHLDMLDVIRYGFTATVETPLPLAMRNDVELFCQAVMPGLFSYVNEAPLDIIIGLVGLITDRVNVPVMVRTKVGLGLLTMFISRAELLKQGGHVRDADWEQWVDVYNRLFDTIEPHLPDIFTTPITSGEDMYVWQFLAAVGIGANPDQQQRLVLGAKDRVMDTVSLSKSLPEDQAAPRLGNVNLFMRAIGLDVELLG